MFYNIGNVRVNVTMRHFICNRCCRGKTTVTYSEYVILALGIQHAMRMPRLSSVSGSALQYFFTLSQKRQGFRKKKVVEKKSELCFSLRTLSKLFLILRITE